MEYLLIFHVTSLLIAMESMGIEVWPHHQLWVQHRIIGLINHNDYFMVVVIIIITFNVAASNIFSVNMKTLLWFHGNIVVHYFDVTVKNMIAEYGQSATKVVDGLIDNSQMQ